MEFYENTEKALKKIDDNVTLLVAQMKLGGKLDPENVIFNTSEMMKVMDVSKRTLQEWRDKNKIGFSKINSKFYYKLSDIKKLLSDNYNPKI
jgi:hypothetical protein